MTARAAPALAVLLALSTAPAAAADATFFFENGTVTAGGRQITVTRLPIRLPTGATVYRDVVVTFRADSAGVVAVAAAPVTTVSPTIPVGSLSAGTYAPVADPAYRLTLAGPVAGPAGRAQWTLDRSGDDVSFRFYAGAVAGHPLSARLAAAGITAAWTYGVVDGGNCDVACSFRPGDLVGLSAGTDGRLYLNDLTDAAGRDRAVPVLTAALRRCTAAGCG
jgi:hypothetical protein